MAKDNKQNQPSTPPQEAAVGAFTDAPAAPATNSPQVDHRDARIAELEQQLAEARAAKAAPAVNPSGPPRNFVVSLQHARSRVVKATDVANAWEAYRKAEGLIATEYQPHIVETDALTPEEEEAAKQTTAA